MRRTIADRLTKAIGRKREADMTRVAISCLTEVGVIMSCCERQL
jgi:hypothetical protein